MSSDTFKALVLRRPAERNEVSIEQLPVSSLPEGDVDIRVRYSTVNYKDGLAITGAGHRQVVESFPFIPGVDFAGVVERSDSSSFAVGDEVILTGWGVGETHWGGFAERARVRSEWLVPVPEGMSMRQSMAYGSAGLSAMLCVDALERHGVDRSKEILVTGAAGGVGSVSLMLLKRLEYRTVASTRRPEEENYLRSLGADRIVDANLITEPPATPLLEERWGGAIDNVGGTTLAHVLASTAYRGAVVSLGLVGGRDLVTTVIPFIKRAVALLGVDSVYCPQGDRIRAWRRLVDLIPDGLSEDVIDEIPLEQVAERAEAIMKGRTRGRTVVAL